MTQIIDPVLSQKIAQIKVDSDILHTVVHGGGTSPPQVSVTTEAGEVFTLPHIISVIQDQLDEFGNIKTISNGTSSFTIDTVDGIIEGYVANVKIFELNATGLDITGDISATGDLSGDTLTIGAGGATVDGNDVLTTADTGAGNGLDADQLDGQHGSYFRNAANLNAGVLPVSRLDGEYDIDISGTANDADNLGGTPAANFFNK